MGLTKTPLDPPLLGVVLSLTLHIAMLHCQCLSRRTKRHNLVEGGSINLFEILCMCVEQIKTVIMICLEQVLGEVRMYLYFTKDT